MNIETPTRKGNGWGIAVQWKDSLWWSMILGTLKSSVHNRETFKNYLKRLSNIEEVSHVNSISKAIWQYNPFIDRYSCFDSEELKDVVNRVKLKFEKSLLDIKVCPYTCSERVFDLLMNVVSLAFCCKVKLIYEGSSASESQDSEEHWFPTRMELAEYYPTITLYCRVIKNKVAAKISREVVRKKIRNRRFLFRLEEGICKNLRQEAFFDAFRLLPLKEKNIEILHSQLDEENDFLRYLLRQDKTILRNLLESHHYILKQLVDAGFINDPSKDKTANKYLLHEAIDGGDFKVVYQIYDYITKRTRWLGNTPRNACINLLKTIDEVTKILKTILGSSETSYNCRECLKELLSFHGFLSQTTKTMHRIDHYKKFTTLQKSKAKILAVLSFYKGNLFQSSEFVVVEDTFLSRFENFRNHFVFFQLMDYHVAQVLFDNLFSIKHCSSLSVDTCEKFESEFSSFIFICQRYWQYLWPRSSRSRNLSDSAMSMLKKIPFVPYSDQAFTPKIKKRFSDICMMMLLQRQKLEVEIENFLNWLEEFDVSKPAASSGNVLLLHQVKPSYQRSDSCDEPNFDIYTLKNEPEIKDEVVLTRLKDYLGLIESVYFLNETESTLVVQRMLQIIGESLKLDPNEPLTLMKCLLVSTFPKQVTRDLRKIRDYLCHYTNKHVNARLVLESNEYNGIFLETCKELRRMKILPDHILKVHEYRLNTYVFTKGVLSSNDYVLESAFYNSEIPTYKNTLEYIQIKCMRRIDKASRNIHELLLSEGCKFYEHYNNHVDWIVDYLEKLKIEEKKLKKKKQFEDKKAEERKRRENCQQTGEQKCSSKKRSRKISKTKSEILTDNEKREQDEIFARFQCLHMILTFVDKYSSFPSPNQEELNTMNGCLQTFEKTTRSSSNELETLLNRFSTLRTKVFGNVGVQINSRISRPCTEFTNIRKLSEQFSNFQFNVLDVSTREDILLREPSKYRLHYTAKAKLCEILEMDTPDESCIMKQLKLLDVDEDKLHQIMNAYNRKDWSNLADYLEGTTDNYAKLKEDLENNRMSCSHFKTYCDMFDFSASDKRNLKTIILGQNDPPDTISYDFFTKSAVIANNLLLESDASIAHLLSTGNKRPGTKNLVHDLLARKLRHQYFQAMIEMMYFNTVGTLIANHKREVLQGCWSELNWLFTGRANDISKWDPAIKLNRLFAGLNVRNMLAHGHPSYELAEQTLVHPRDLANELVHVLMKVLELSAARDPSRRNPPNGCCQMVVYNADETI